MLCRWTSQWKTDEYIVDQIVGHNIFDPTDTQWRDRWASDDTWDPLANVKDVEVFHNDSVEQATTFYSIKTFETFAWRGEREHKALNDSSHKIVLANFLV